MVRYSVMLALLCALVAGCGKSPGDDMKGKVEDVKAKAKETADHVWSGTVKTIDRAKGVGQTLMDSAEEQRRKIDKESE